MLYLDDRLPTHPKILKAGALLGPGGASRALHLYVLGLTYARLHLTDGYLPSSFIASCGVVSKSGFVANVLSARGIGLWRKVKGGYQIHDYHDYNPKASEVKEKREIDRQRKARERAGRNGNVSSLDTSRTRARAVPVPSTHRGRTSTNQLEVVPPALVQATSKNKPPRCARRPIDLRQLCGIARAVRMEPESEWAEAIKIRLARQGWAYPPPHLITEAMTRVRHAA